MRSCPTAKRVFERLKNDLFGPSDGLGSQEQLDQYFNKGPTTQLLGRHDVSQFPLSTDLAQLANQTLVHFIEQPDPVVFYDVTQQFDLAAT